MSWKVIDGDGHSRGPGGPWKTIARTGEDRIVHYNLYFTASGDKPATPADGKGVLYAQTNNGHTQLNWIDEDGTVIRLNRDSILIVRNTSGSDMVKGDVVNITGATGQVPTVGLADADTFSLHAEGILLEDIANNAFGFMMSAGQLTGVNTGSFSAGDKLYLSSTAGDFTNTAPSAPATYQELGVVVTSSASAGVIEVAIQTATRQTSPITLATEQASTSGTVIDFTGIPSGVRQITIQFEGVSTDGTSDILIQIGDTDGIEATTYLAGSLRASGGAITAVTAVTNGFNIVNPAATRVWHGTYTLTLKDSSNFTWVGCGTMYSSDGPEIAWGSGSKSLSAELTQVRITSVTPNNFDAGSINISYL